MRQQNKPPAVSVRGVTISRIFGIIFFLLAVLGIMVSLSVPSAPFAFLPIFAAVLSDLDGFLRLKHVLALVPVSKSTLWEWVRQGKFPQPLKLGVRCTVWRRSTVKNYIDQIGGEGQNDC
jgi:prophage regulatory protein